MSNLSTEVNFILTLLFIFCIGLLIYRIDRRVKKEGPLVKRDGSGKSRIYALVIGFILGGFTVLEWIVGFHITLFVVLSIALIGYGLGFDHLLEIFQPKQAAPTISDIPGVEWLTVNEIKMYVQTGAKFFTFEYCLSLFTRTTILQSRIYFFKPGETYTEKIIFFCLVSIVLGWSNPVRLYKTLRTNIRGGNDVTDRVLLCTSPIRSV
jgi:hypothetical protein